MAAPKAMQSLLKPLLAAEAVGQIEDERNCKDSQDHGVDQHRHDVGGNKFHVQGGHGREDGDLQAEPLAILMVFKST